MFGGDLVLREGPCHYTLRYDERGIVCGAQTCGGDLFWAARAPHRMPLAIDASARPPEARPLTLRCRDDLEHEMSADRIAAMLLVTDQPERIRMRVWLPVPVPGGAELVPNVALPAMRRALADRVPPGARIVVADGFAGTALAFGECLEDAMAAWQVALWRHKPGSAIATPEVAPPDPPTAVPAPREPTDGDNVHRLGRDVERIELGKHTFAFGPPASSVPLPALVPGNTPAARIVIDRDPPPVLVGWSAAGFDRWVRVLGGAGAVGFVLVREHADRVVLVGEGVLDIVDPEEIDAGIDEILATQVEEMRESVRAWPEFAASVEAPRFTRFRVWDAVAQRPCFGFAGSGGADGVPWEIADGDELRWCVACWSR